MTTTTQATPKTLNANELTALAKAKGPCVTIQVPDFQPGSGASRTVLLRQLTQTAAAKLREMNKSGEVEKVITSLDHIAAIEEANHGGPGLTIFCSSENSVVYRTPGVRENATVGEHFDLLPHIEAATAPHTVYALGVNKKHIRLWKVEGGIAEELPLPAGVPKSLEEAGGYDRPDHDLENRSSAGPSGGGIRGIRFGTSSDRDTDAAYLHNFLNLVHRGIKTAVKGAPVFLIGTKDELIEYRKSAKENGLLETEWHTTSEYVAADQVAAHVREAALVHARSTAEATVSAIPEANHLSGNLDEITKAAKEGRIHKLVVAMNNNAAGALNTAVVEALKTGAEVAALPVADLPQIGIAGAILRY